MAATFDFGEDNGAATGSPSKGTTRTQNVTQVNWKNTDDVGTVYTSSPITAGNNSFSKYQFGRYTGTYNLISNGLWGHTAGTLGTGLTLMGKVTSTYATPSATTNAALDQNMTSVLGSFPTGAQTVNFHGTGPEGAGPTATIATAPAYTQFLATQLQTTSSAAAGDTATVTLTLRYDEN
jgi:hypothetical protein